MRTTVRPELDLSGVARLPGRLDPLLKREMDCMTHMTPLDRPVRPSTWFRPTKRVHGVIFPLLL